jgi:hypothetical protein
LKDIHNIDEAEAYQQYKHKREKAASVDQSKPMLLCEDIADQKLMISVVSMETSLSIHAMWTHPSDQESRGFGKCLMIKPKVHEMK